MNSEGTIALTDYFDALGPQVTTLVGCGGKTATLWKLAQSTRAHKTLVTTTTHIAAPPQAENRYDHFIAQDTAFSPPATGVTLAGVTLVGGARGRSLKSLPLAQLEQLIPHYEYVYIEGDGSRTLPLKAWERWEPVVTQSTGVTVGILPLWPLGMPINETIVHRLPLFLTLTGAEAGEPLRLEHLAALIAGSKTQGGLFSAARGKKILFLNQVEDPAALARARALIPILPQNLKDSLHSIIAGSAQRNSIHIF
jgi:probable selenium-dependent hydroxylase accessory protein YqeC